MSKRKAGVTVAKTAVKHPRGARLGVRAARPPSKLAFKVAKPMVKRRVLARADEFVDTAQTVGQILVIYGPMVAYELGLAERPKPKRTAPRVAVGIAIGAAATYVLVRRSPSS